jgi:hypothetical protein
MFSVDYFKTLGASVSSYSPGVFANFVALFTKNFTGGL